MRQCDLAIEMFELGVKLGEGGPSNLLISKGRNIDFFDADVLAGEDLTEG